MTLRHAPKCEELFVPPLRACRICFSWIARIITKEENKLSGCPHNYNLHVKLRCVVYHPPNNSSSRLICLGNCWKLTSWFYSRELDSRLEIFYIDFFSPSNFTRSLSVDKFATVPFFFFYKSTWYTCIKSHSTRWYQ